MAQREYAHENLLVVEHQSGETVVLSAAGTLDMVTAPQFRHHADAILSRRPPALIIDLRRVEFLATAGIAVLMRVQNESGSMRYVVVADGSATARPLRLLGIDNIIRVVPTMADAIESLGVTEDQTG